MEPGFHKPGNDKPSRTHDVAKDASMEPGFHKPGNGGGHHGGNRVVRLASMEPGFHKPGNRPAAQVMLTHDGPGFNGAGLS